MHSDYYYYYIKKKEVTWLPLQYNNTIKGLTCTFRASCYSVCLSWALVLTWVSPFVQDIKKLGVGRRVSFLATTFALKEASFTHLSAAHPAKSTLD